MQSNLNRLQRVCRPKTNKREASVIVPKIMLPNEHKHEENYFLIKQHRLHIILELERYALKQRGTVENIKHVLQNGTPKHEQLDEKIRRAS